MKWVKVDGTLYKKPCIVVVKISEELLPIFGQLNEILLIRDEVHFHLQLYNTVYYHEHYNAYVVSLTTQYNTMNSKDLLSYLPLCVRNVNGIDQKAVVLKHHISLP